MTENILVSVIGGLCVAIPSLIATITQNKKSTSLITYRVDRLEKKVEKPTVRIERTRIEYPKNQSRIEIVRRAPQKPAKSRHHP